MTGKIQTFAIDRNFAAQSKWAPWALLAFVLFFVALPFLLDDDRSLSHPRTIGLSLLGVIFFGGLSWLGFRTAKRLPQCSVSANNEGLWPAHLSKEIALIRWEEIHSIRERVYLQRLDLLDKNGTVLMKLEYQLSGFEELRALVIDKIHRPTQPVPSGKFAKKPIYHAFNVGGITGFSVLGWYVGTSNPLIGYVGMAVLVTLIVHEYLTTVTRVELLRDRLRIDLPIQTQEIFRGQIEAVQIGDIFNQGARHPEVALFIRGEGKPIRLSGLGVDAVNLHQIIEQWRQNS